MKTTKKLNDGRIKLTKNNINDGYIREFINKIEGSDKVLSDKELIEERNKILPSSIQNQNLYVFAYGSPSMCQENRNAHRRTMMSLQISFFFERVS